MSYVPAATKIGAVAAGVAAVALVPYVLSDFRASDFARVAIFFIAICGLNLLTGFTGQVSLGHGAFMAIGGYTTALLVAGRSGLEEAGLDPPAWIPLGNGMRDLWTIPFAGLVAGLAGFLVGLPALRLTGLYLALATFAVAVAMPTLIDEGESLTGGTNGINLFGLDTLTGASANEVHVLGRALTYNDWLYYLTWSVALVLLGAAWLLLRGRTGRAFRAIRDNETAAVASGVSLATYKTLAFAISAFYAGIAGSLLAISATIVAPAAFGPLLSIELLIGGVVAGLGSLRGIVFGALFLQFLRIGIAEVADVGALPDRVQRAAESPGIPSVAYGVALILILFAVPRGAAALLTTRR